MPQTVGYPAPELTGVDGEDIVRLARARLAWGKRFRETKREPTWRQSERQYEGRHWVLAESAQDPTADLVTINVSFSTVNTLVPYVTGSDPRFTVEPYSQDATIRNARAQGAWLNRYWRTTESGARQAVRLAAVDSLVYGDGWGKVTYEIRPLVRNQEEGPEIAEIHVDRVDPWNIWIDPMADGMHNARWVCERIYTTKQELEADGRYSNLDDLSTGIPDFEDQGTDRHIRRPVDGQGEEGSEWVEIYEFWDLVEGRMVAFGRDGSKPIRVIEQVICPILNLENHWLPGQPYHMGDLEQIWPMQKELNKSRSQMLTHRRRNIPKYLVKRDAIGEDAEEALSSEVVGAMVPIDGDEPLSNIIQAVNLTPLTADNYNVSDLITRDIFEVTGVNEYLRGATPQIRRTATEASIIEGASNVKSAHKLGKIEEFVRELGSFVLDVAADVFPQTDYDELELYITGRDAEALNRGELGERLIELQQSGAPPEILQAEAGGSDLYGATRLTMGPDLFEGIYQVEVVANSTELRNPIFKEQKYREMARQLTESADLLANHGVRFNLKKIYELWFEAAGIQDIDSLFAEAGQGGFPAAQPPQPQGPRGGDLSSLLTPEPNLDAEGAPSDPLTALNTGALPPEGFPESA